MAMLLPLLLGCGRIGFELQHNHPDTDAGTQARDLMPQVVVETAVGDASAAPGSKGDAGQVATTNCDPLCSEETNDASTSPEPTVPDASVGGTIAATSVVEPSVPEPTVVEPTAPAPTAPEPSVVEPSTTPPTESCNDSIQNQDETGVDCGGICIPCVCTLSAPIAMDSLNYMNSWVWSPTISVDGLTLYVASSGFGLQDEIFISTRASLSDDFPVGSLLPPPVNGSVEGTPHLTHDGLRMYFFSMRSGGPGDRDLYVASRPSTADEFDTVTELAGINTKDREHLPWLSADELTMYFASNRAGAGVDDIYVATRSTPDGAFDTPIAVAELNSTGNDAGMTLTADLRVIFFASDRSGGVGGMDLYRAARASTSEPFSTPELVTTLSSTGQDQDLALSPDDQELYFVSTRNGISSVMYRASRTCP